jgi:glycerol-3-phosphate acyltransferase PlsX
MRIALDAMGGDRAPAAPVGGAVRALRAFDDVEVVLVGPQALLEEEIARHDVTAEERLRLDGVEADHVAAMGEDPVRAVRTHARNTVRVCAELLREGDVRGVVSMGSTGAAVAAAQLYCGRLEGVRRPGIAVPFPRPGGTTLVVDAGANPEARPEDLYQFAVMASLYARSALEIERPRVGILSIGEEEHKGNQLVHDTWAFFRAHAVPDFVGNVEPREFFEDKADVVVADGFSGNVALKAAEGMAEYLLGALRDALPEGEAGDRILASVAERVDYAEYGGAPLLGIRGPYLIGHGRSDARAVFNALRAVRAYEMHHVGQRTVEQLARASALPASGADGAPR